MAPNPNPSGYNTPESELEGFMPVHPTAARRPHTLVVQSENTAYTDDFITAKYQNRGAEVTVADGKFIVSPTVDSFEFQTKRAVSKTG
jgi:myo-inositol-1-phosphate synthase